MRPPREGALRRRRPKSRKLVTIPKRRRVSTANHAPLAVRSRPPTTPSVSAHGASGTAGRSWNSSRFAATTSRYRGWLRHARTNKHIWLPAAWRFAGSAEPRIDESRRDRAGGRQGGVSRGQVGSREPLRMLELAVAQRDVVAAGHGTESEHQRGGERPGL